MLRSSVYPTAFYGTELLLVPLQVLENFRTQVANAVVGQNSHSMSSSLLVNLLPQLRDPFLHVILQSVKQARRFLAEVVASERCHFFRVVAEHSNTFKVDGPASVLREYLARVGLSLNKQGWILGTDCDHVHFTHSSLVDVIRTVEHEWQKHLLVLQTDRKGIGSALPIQREGTLRVLAGFEPTQHLQLLREIAGGFQTKSQQQQWETAEDGLCPWCHQELDTS